VHAVLCSTLCSKGRAQVSRKPAQIKPLCTELLLAFVLCSPVRLNAPAMTGNCTRLSSAPLRHSHSSLRCAAAKASTRTATAARSARPATQVCSVLPSICCGQRGRLNCVALRCRLRVEPDRSDCLLRLSARQASANVRVGPPLILSASVQLPSRSHWLFRLPLVREWQVQQRNRPVAMLHLQPR
jgi:hypothetical protein